MTMIGIYATGNSGAVERLLSQVAALPGGSRPSSGFAISGVDMPATAPGEAVTLLDGAIQVDCGAGSVRLSRDRFGTRSLYHAEPVAGCVLFADSLETLPKLLEAGISPAALPTLLRLGYVPAPETIYTGIHKVPAASAETIAVADSRRTLQCLWEPPATDDDSALTLEEAGQRLSEMLQGALTANLSSGPADLLLSGGIDSGMVGGLAQKFCPDSRRQAFTIACDVPGYDESPVAAQTAAINGLPMQRIMLRPANVMELLPKLMAVAGEPFADASLVACALAFSNVPEGRRILMGDGGDELFGGYRRYRAMALRQRLPQWLDTALRPLCRLGARMIPEGTDARDRRATIQRTLAMGALPRIDAYATFQQLCDPQTAAELIPDTAREVSFLEDWRRILEQQPAGSRLLPYNYLDLRCYLPEDGCRKVEIAARFAGRSAIAPIMADPVADFALALPRRLRFNAREGKLVERQLSQSLGLLPADALNAPKRGFGLPLSHWFRQGALTDHVAQVAHSLREWDSTGLLSPAVCQRLAQEHRQGSRNHAGALWLLVCLHAWMSVHK